MREITDHNAYKMLRDNYDRTAIDYVILSVDTDYDGIATHKAAIIEAFKILNLRKNFESDSDYLIKLDAEKMEADLISIEELLELPTDSYYDNRNKKSRGFSIPKPLPYWFAFLDPPYRVPYLTTDFIAFNNILFPNKEHCEVYRWNDDFSNYFDDGKEWWGTGLWSIYDSVTGLIVIIGASLTD